MNTQKLRMLGAYEALRDAVGDRDIHLVLVALRRLLLSAEAIALMALSSVT